MYFRILRYIFCIPSFLERQLDSEHPMRCKFLSSGSRILEVVLLGVLLEKIICSLEGSCLFCMQHSIKEIRKTKANNLLGLLPHSIWGHNETVQADCFFTHIPRKRDLGFPKSREFGIMKL